MITCDIYDSEPQMLLSIPLVQRKRVAVFPAPRLKAEERLLEALAEVFPLEFAAEGAMGLEQANAAIFFPEASAMAKRVFGRGVSAFGFSAPPPGMTLGAEALVSLSGSSRVHPAFRNSRIPIGGESGVGVLLPGVSDNVLASHDATPLWAFRASGGAELHSTAFTPPHLGSGESLWSYLQPGYWMRILPLLHFLRGVTAEFGWTSPAQRACFIFDDPNLHSHRYGYMDFAQLASHAEAHGYHVALAMIPIDAWYAAPKAVFLFHQHRRCLSLLIHGNDHVRNELSRDAGEGEALRVLAQALRRITRFERRTGLDVARVIAAPHGACSESMMAQMLRFALEGACISVPSVLHWNPQKNRAASFGLQPASIMAGGCPVVHRFNLRHGLLPARFAAFWGQPIVPYGHHQDCAAGLGTLAEIADAVNSWGPVEWCGFEALFHGLCRTRQEGELLNVELWSRQVELTIPAGVSHLMAQFAGAGLAEAELTAVLNGASPQDCQLAKPIAVEAGSSVRLRILSADSVDPASIERRRSRLWPPMRRTLTLGRDRFLPMLRGMRP